MRPLSFGILLLRPSEPSIHHSSPTPSMYGGLDKDLHHRANWGCYLDIFIPLMATRNPAHQLRDRYSSLSHYLQGFSIIPGGAGFVRGGVNILTISGKGDNGDNSNHKPMRNHLQQRCWKTDDSTFSQKKVNDKAAQFPTNSKAYKKMLKWLVVSQWLVFRGSIYSEYVYTNSYLMTSLFCITSNLCVQIFPPGNQQLANPPWKMIVTGRRLFCRLPILGEDLRPIFFAEQTICLSC